MKDFLIFRDNRMADRWDEVARLQALSAHEAVRRHLSGNQTIEAARYIAIPTDEVTEFIESYPAHRLHVALRPEGEPS